MNDLDQGLQTAFEATNLILVFVIILFDLRYPQIQRDIHEEIPPGDKAKQQLRKKLRESLMVNCAPLLLINGVASYLFAPLFMRILSESRIEPWNFDFARTSFVLIAMLIFTFFLWSGYLAYHLVKRMRDSR